VGTSLRIVRPACFGMRTLSRAAQALLAMALLLPSAHCAAGERPLTVDDILKLSHVGRAAARPGSNTFVWEKSPPYDTLGDYGSGDTATWWDSDAEIWTVGPNSAIPRRLFRPLARTTYVLGDFSADGRFLTLLAVHGGKVNLAAYDFRLRRLREYPLAPRAGLFGPDWAWVDNRRLAIAAYPSGDGPWQFTFRRAIGDRLAASWAKSWKGKEPSVDRFDSSADDTIQPLPGRLAIVDLMSGHIQQLASGQFAAPHLSPDGRWLAAVRQSKLPQSSLEHPHLDWTYARSILAVFSLKESPVERDGPTELDVLPDNIEWSPSSKRVAFYAAHAGESLRTGDFWLFDPSDSTAAMIPHAGLSLVSRRARGGPQWPERAVWLKDSLVVFARSTPGQPGSMAFEDLELNGVVDSRVAVLSVPAHWFLLSANSAPRDLTPGMQEVSPRPVLANGTQFIVVGDERAWSLDASAPPLRLFPTFDQRLDALANRDLLLAKANGGEGFFPILGEPGKLARVEMKDGSPALRLVATSPGTLVLAMAKSGRALAQIGFGKGAELALIGPDGKPEMLGELNPFLDQIAETRWTDFHYANGAGSQRADLSGCLLLPPNYRSGHRYPLIVEVYPDRPGGCGSAQRRNQFAMAARPTAYTEHLLAARGFMVFRPDTGGGISRTDAGPQAALPEVVDRGIDAVLAAGYGDPDRIGLMGFSQGGFASLWVATQSHRYKAVVSLNGWSDLTDSFFGMNWTQELAPTEMSGDGRSETYLTPAGSDWYMGGTPWNMPQRYIANSPLWRSDAVSAPVLLIHSDMDAFDDAAYKSFFTSLYIQKKDARLLIYRGEGHAPSSPANIRHMWENIFSWFDKYLKVKRDSTGAIVLEEQSAAVLRTAH
jgi:dipeptidyl aminopeptidase/acylaminoacyl peptidase